LAQAWHSEFDCGSPTMDDGPASSAPPRDAEARPADAQVTNAEQISVSSVEPPQDRGASIRSDSAADSLPAGLLDVPGEEDLDDNDTDDVANDLADPWNLIRIAMGSLAGESWRLKQALVWPTEAFHPRGAAAAVAGEKRCAVGADLKEALWDEFRGTQTYEDFKRALPFRPNSTSGVIDFVIVGEVHRLKEALDLEALLPVLEAFIGFPVHMRESLPIGQWACHRMSIERREQIGAHFVLAQMRGSANPRSVCTVGLTSTDLYPPKTYEFVTGMTDASQRVAIFSTARYFFESPKKDQQRSQAADQDGDAAERRASSPPITPEMRREYMTACVTKALCREVLKLCSMGDCQLLHCLMNPFPGGPPESVRSLPLSLCCICLRKLQWLTQTDLLDRYARLPAVLGDRFLDEAVWIWERMVQVGMPTYASLRDANSLRGKT